MDLNDWLWAGFFGMVAGAVILFAMGFKYRNKEELNHFLLHFFVVLLATASYFAMATGDGRFVLDDGRDVFFARYLDWNFTTPMLLTALTLTALHNPFRNWALLLGLVFTDMYMILTGLFADLSPTGSGQKWVWYLLSSGAFVFIYYTLWGPMRAEAKKTGERAYAVYTRNLPVLSILWLIYPLNFLFGVEGLRTYGAETSVAIYAVLDVCAKVLYGIYSLANTKNKVTEDLKHGEVPAHEVRPTAEPHHEVWALGRNSKDPRFPGSEGVNVDRTEHEGQVRGSDFKRTR